MVSLFNIEKTVEENPEPIKDSGFLKSCIAKISVKLDAALIVYESLQAQIVARALLDDLANKHARL